MDSAIKPIQRFGAVLIILDLGAIVFFGNLFLLDKSSPLYVFGTEQQSYQHLYFWAGSVIFYLLTGIGVVYLTRWGYYLFKIFLYLLLLVLPVGTYISYRTLSYMKRHHLKRYFGFAESST
jgi:hypothetical protein